MVQTFYEGDFYWLVFIQLLHLDWFLGVWAFVVTFSSCTSGVLAMNYQYDNIRSLYDLAC